MTGDKVNSGIGSSNRPPQAGGPVRQPYAGVNFIPPSQGSMNSAIGHVHSPVSTYCNSQPWSSLTLLPQTPLCSKLCRLVCHPSPYSGLRPWGKIMLPLFIRAEKPLTLYSTVCTLGAFNFKNFMGFKLRLIDICNKVIFYFCKIFMLI